MEEAELDIDELAKRYQQILQDEGYACKNPTKDSEANTLDLVIKYEGLNLLIIFDYDDPSFVRIMLPNFYEVAEKDVGTALGAINEASKTCKGAKLYLTQDLKNCLAVVEYLENGKSVNSKELLRYVSMVINVAKFYAQKMKEDKAD